MRGYRIRRAARLRSSIDAGMTPAPPLPDAQTWDFSSASMPTGATLLRTGAGTYRNVSGIIATASADNSPRFDYSPSLSLRGLLVEEGSENLATNSEDLSTYTLTRLTATTDASTAPDGNTTGDRLLETTQTGVHIITKTSLSSAEGNYCLSVFGKHYLGGRYLVVRPYNVGNIANVVFDLQAGSIFSQVGDNLLSATIEAYESGWYRCSVEFNNIPDGNLGLSIVYSTDGTVMQGYTGNSLYGNDLWGVQFETGASSSYIATGASTATRNSETLRLSNVAYSTIKATYDDDSTSNISVTPGATVDIPAASFTRKWVKKVEEV